MNDFESLVIQKLMNIERRLATVEVKAGLFGAISGAISAIGALAIGWLLR